MLCESVDCICAVSCYGQTIWFSESWTKVYTVAYALWLLLLCCCEVVVVVVVVEMMLLLRLWR